MINVIYKIEKDKVEEILERSKLLGVALYGNSINLNSVTDNKGLTYFVDEALEEIRQDLMLSEIMKQLDVIEQMVKGTGEKVDLGLETNENEEFKRKVWKFIFGNK
ncbi:hypothetical protein V7149_23095 [Bacillus sp. JJ1503]|uniref:hypothetical protein n=1 Tax=Bacillus sp. JJ1503 TaxID=3122956 RepID=UPI002FFF6952